MDVSGWTIDERMRLPDWCFGNRKVVSCQLSTQGAGSIRWISSAVTLTDPVCIWSVGMFITENDYKFNYVRLGLADSVPTSEVEMDASVNIFPDLGDIDHTPPRIVAYKGAGPGFQMPVRKGLITGGKKFVMEAAVHVSGTVIVVLVYMVVSGLPTSMAGWLAHNK